MVSSTNIFSHFVWYWFFVFLWEEKMERNLWRGVSYTYLFPSWSSAEFSWGAQQMTPRNSGKHVFIWSNWARVADGSWYLRACMEFSIPLPTTKLNCFSTTRDYCVGWDGIWMTLDYGVISVSGLCSWSMYSGVGLNMTWTWHSADI